MLSKLLQVAGIEILGRIRRRSFYVVLGAILALMWSSAAIGAEDILARRAAYAWHLGGVVREQVTPRAPLMGWSVEAVLRTAREPELGSVLARGEDIRLAPYFDFGPAGVVWGRTLVADHSQTQVGALLDLESILRVLGGLLALLLGIDAVGGSRFSGQLRAWEALGFSPITGALGKLVGCCMVLVSSALFAVTAGAVSASVALPDDGRTIATTFARGFLPFPLYLCGLAAAGAAMALWCRTTTIAVVAGVALWVTVAMIGPQVSVIAGRLLVPTTNRAELEAARDEEFEADMRASEVALGQMAFGWVGDASATVMAEAIENHQSELEAAWSTQAAAARESAIVHDRSWHQARVRRAGFDMWLQVLIPGASLVRAASALAGTGAGLADAWYESAEVHQRQLNAALFDDRPKVTLKVPPGRLTGFVRHLPVKWSNMPPFPNVASSHRPWRDAAGPMAAMFGYLALAVAAVVAGVRRLAD